VFDPDEDDRVEVETEDNDEPLWLLVVESDQLEPFDEPDPLEPLKDLECPLDEELSELSLMRSPNQSKNSYPRRLHANHPQPVIRPCYADLRWCQERRPGD